MSYKDLFKSVKSDILQYNFLSDVFSKAKKKKTFKMMVNSIRTAFRDQITDQLDLDLEEINQNTLDNFNNKINRLGVNMNTIVKKISKWFKRLLCDR